MSRPMGERRMSDAIQKQKVGVCVHQVYSKEYFILVVKKLLDFKSDLDHDNEALYIETCF